MTRFSDSFWHCAFRKCQSNSYNEASHGWRATISIEWPGDEWQGVETCQPLLEEGSDETPGDGKHRGDHDGMVTNASIYLLLTSHRCLVRLLSIELLSYSYRKEAVQACWFSFMQQRLLFRTLYIVPKFDRLRSKNFNQVIVSPLRPRDHISSWQWYSRR